MFQLTLRRAFVTFVSVTIAICLLSCSRPSSTAALTPAQSAAVTIEDRAFAENVAKEVRQGGPAA
jgi:hypothetical protein